MNLDDIEATIRDGGYPAQLELLEMVAEIRRLRARLDKCEEALVWCSGSPSFAPEGEARVGWLALCAPLLASLRIEPPTDNQSESR